MNLLRKYSLLDDYGSSDLCERIICCLEACSSQGYKLLNGDLSRQASVNADFLANIAGKGCLYRGVGMLAGLEERPLIEQVFYLNQKFSEFYDRLVIVDEELTFCRNSPVQLAQSVQVLIAKLLNPASCQRLKGGGRVATNFLLFRLSRMQSGSVLESAQSRLAGIHGAEDTLLLIAPTITDIAFRDTNGLLESVSLTFISSDEICCYELSLSSKKVVGTGRGTGSARRDFDQVYLEDLLLEHMGISASSSAALSSSCEVSAGEAGAGAGAGPLEEKEQQRMPRAILRASAVCIVQDSTQRRCLRPSKDVDQAEEKSLPLQSPLWTTGNGCRDEGEEGGSVDLGAEAIMLEEQHKEMLDEHILGTVETVTACRRKEDALNVQALREQLLRINAILNEEVAVTSSATPRKLTASTAELISRCCAETQNYDSITEYVNVQVQTSHMVDRLQERVLVEKRHQHHQETPLSRHCPDKCADSLRPKASEEPSSRAKAFGATNGLNCQPVPLSSSLIGDLLRSSAGASLISGNARHSQRAFLAASGPAEKRRGEGDEEGDGDDGFRVGEVDNLAQRAYKTIRDRVMRNILNNDSEDSDTDADVDNTAVTDTGYTSSCAGAVNGTGTQNVISYECIQSASESHASHSPDRVQSASESHASHSLDRVQPASESHASHSLDRVQSVTEGRASHSPDHTSAGVADTAEQKFLRDKLQASMKRIQYEVHYEAAKRNFVRRKKGVKIMSVLAGVFSHRQQHTAERIDNRSISHNSFHYSRPRFVLDAAAIKISSDPSVIRSDSNRAAPVSVSNKSAVDMPTNLSTTHVRRAGPSLDVQKITFPSVRLEPRTPVSPVSRTAARVPTATARQQLQLRDVVGNASMLSELLQRPFSPPKQAAAAATAAAAAAATANTAAASKQMKKQNKQATHATCSATTATFETGSTYTNYSSDTREIGDLVYSMQSQEPPPPPLPAPLSGPGRGPRLTPRATETAKIAPIVAPTRDHIVVRLAQKRGGRCGGGGVGGSGGGASPSRRAHKLTNVSQVKNAITNVCLAGTHFQEQRLEVLEIISYLAAEGKRSVSSTRSGPRADHSVGAGVLVPDELKDWLGRVQHFVVMFSQAKTLSYKAIYASHPDADAGMYCRIHGKGPKDLRSDSSTIIKFLKFETSSKSFKLLQVKTLSNAVDGVVLDASHGRARLKHSHVV